MKKICMNYDRPMPSVETPAIIHGNNGCKSTIACWDTGSNVTLICNDIAKELGLEELPGLTGFNLGGHSFYRRYKVKINLGNGIIVNGNFLARDKLSKEGRVGIIVGMDIISMGDFKLLSLKGKTQFSFEVDF